MKSTLMESRVRSLEEMMADLIATVEQTSIEVRASTDKMERDTDNFKEKTDATLDRMEEDTAKFREEMRLDRVEARQDHRDLNRQLGDIANKQGRLTEDLVAPSICRILREVVHCPRRFECGSLVRPRRTHPVDRGRLKEFDVIADCGDYVLVNETKSNLGPEDIGILMDTIEEVREYFPEFRDRKIIGSLATLYAEESLIKFASRKGILILAVGDELMDVKNEPGFKPAIF
ncbi:MAG: hypothetical protein ACYDHG_15395 [Desulfomonilaceae bacterium]